MFSLLAQSQTNFAFRSQFLSLNYAKLSTFAYSTTELSPL